MTRHELEKYIEENYGVTADYPFTDDLITGVFRHPSNRKWFAIAMHIPKSKLIADADGYIDVVNVKCDTEVIYTFRGQRGVYPAYHMNRAHWLTLALDGSVERETIEFLLGISYDLTKPKIKRNR